MIGKEEFIKLIQSYTEQNDRVNALSEVFYMAYENPIIDWGFLMFDKVLGAYFDNTGYEWIEYYLYKNPEKCYYNNGNRVPLRTLEDLWELVKDFRI